jgi:hypothetical protein
MSEISFTLPRLPHLPGGRLKRWVRLIFVIRSYAKEICACIGRYPLRNVLYGLWHGFAADRVLLYGADAIGSFAYLTDFQRQFSRFINPKSARELLEDKVLFESVVGRLARVPKNFLYADDGRVIVLSDEWFEMAACADSEKSHKVVLKRARGGGGIKIKFLEIKSGLVDDGKDRMPIPEFLKYLVGHEGYILCEFVEQSKFFREIYPGTTNTLRVICMRDRIGEPFIARAVLRLGTRRSNGVDNFGRGGLAANIDLATGVLGNAIEHDVSQPRKPIAYKSHPDTKVEIAGRTVPNWEATMNEALDLMRKLPFINYAGWDIIVAEEDRVFLEGNNYSGVRLAQLCSGLLQDPQVRDFYQRYGIVPLSQSPHRQ